MERIWCVWKAMQSHTCILYYILNTKEIAEHRIYYMLNCCRRFKSKSIHLHINFECSVFDTKFRAYVQCTCICAFLEFLSVSLSYLINLSMSFDVMFFFLCYFYSFARSLVCFCRCFDSIRFNSSSLIVSKRICWIYNVTCIFSHIDFDWDPTFSQPHLATVLPIKQNKSV